MKMIECKNCKYMYNCQYTCWGSCDNGLEFEKEESMKNETKYRSVKMSYWNDICEKYNENNLVNCDGDIFFIDETHADYLIGRRVLWSLDLTNEHYKIIPITDKDDDGIEYVLTYKIKLAD